MSNSFDVTEIDLDGARRDAAITTASTQMSTRERQLDPQLPVRGVPPEPEDADRKGSEAPTVAGPGAGSVMVARADGEVLAWGLSRVERFADGDPQAVWGALNRAELDLRWSGDADAVNSLLQHWISVIIPKTCERGDWETSLAVKVPSRDSGLVRPLLSHGFALASVTGIRMSHGEPDAAEALKDLAQEGVSLRAATPEDIPALATMDTELLRHDSQHGAIEVRSNSRDVLIRGIEERLRVDPHLTWIVEQRGDAKGYVSFEADRPAHRSQCSGEGPIAYLQAMYLSPSLRGAGVGAAVVQFVHSHLAHLGYERITLGYAALNPRSGPFWCRSGYRPLWNEWLRRPALPHI